MRFETRRRRRHFGVRPARLKRQRTRSRREKRAFRRRRQHRTKLRRFRQRRARSRPREHSVRRSAGIHWKRGTSADRTDRQVQNRNGMQSRLSNHRSRKNYRRMDWKMNRAASRNGPVRLRRRKNRTRRRPRRRRHAHGMGHGRRLRRHHRMRKLRLHRRRGWRSYRTRLRGAGALRTNPIFIRARTLHSQRRTGCACVFKAHRPAAVLDDANRTSSIEPHTRLRLTAIPLPLHAASSARWTLPQIVIRGERPGIERR